MSTARLMQMGAAGEGNHPIPVTDVEDVFSTYLYEGNGSTQTITNGIDLDGEGGLVWIKSRTSASSHVLFDTERGTNRYLRSNTTALEVNNPPYELSAFNSDGFTVGDASGAAATVNGSSTDYASWTFRKAPKFFDVVTFSQTGSNAHTTVSHNLGSTPGMIIVKSLTNIGNWYVSHRSIDPTAYLLLSSTDASSGPDPYGPFVSSSSTSVTFGQQSGAAGDYVAYLFAHNDGDGEFGPTGDADIIKCGSCSGETGSNRDISLGFEPQFVITKAVDATGDWRITDTMRGLPADGTGVSLAANTASSESSDDTLHIKSNGFYVNGLPGSGDYIYMAIRRGTKVPESATEVFGSSQDSIPTFGFPPDATLILDTAGGTTYHDKVTDRLRGSGNTLITNSTAAEVDEAQQYYDFNYDGNQNTFGFGWGGPQFTVHGWKRAPKFFDALAYTGNSNGSTPTQTLTHNLGVKPEMMWVKSRGSSQNWYVFHKDVWDATNNYYLRLNGTSQANASDGSIFPSDVTDTQFTVSERWEVNQSGVGYISYLFASLDGISKVGSYTGNGTSQTIDCGFSSGARFILVKRTDTTGDWYVWDTERGIVTGNDPFLELNTTDAEVTSDDSVDPDVTGFIVNQTATTNINVSSAEYIFYAIA